MGKHDEAWMVLKQIHDTNMRARGEPERVFTVSTHRPPHPAHHHPAHPAVPAAADRSVSPSAGEQDQDPQTAGRAGGAAERVIQPGAEGPLQDQGRAQRSTTLFFFLVFILTVVKIQTK